MTQTSDSVGQPQAVGLGSLADEGLVPQIAKTLAEFQGEESLKQLFWQVLSYDRVRQPLPPRFVPEAVRPHVDGLEVYASHGNVQVVYAHASGGLERPLIERLCRSLVCVMPNCILILHDGSRGEWSVVYPDDTKKAFLRFLSLPGRESERMATARALAALSTWDAALDVPRGWLEIASCLEVLFPGATPAAREDLKQISDYIRDISRFPTLTAPQERGEDLLSAGTPHDGCRMDYRLWRLVVSNLRFVVWMAQKYPRLGLEIDDLIQEGNLGLVLAAPRFDTARGARFLTYAGYWVKQRILSALSENCNLIRWPAPVVGELMRANLNGECACLPAGQRFVESLTGVSENRFRGVAARYEPSVTAEQGILRERIMRAVNTLKPMHRQLMVLRYGLEGGSKRTLEEIGERLHFTRERVRQIEKKCLQVLEKRIPKSKRDSVAPGRDHREVDRCRKGTGEAVPGSGEDAKKARVLAPVEDDTSGQQQAEDTFVVVEQVHAKEQTDMRDGDSEVTAAFGELLQRLAEAEGRYKTAGSQAIQSGDLDGAVAITNEIREMGTIAQSVRQTADQWADLIRGDDLSKEDAPVPEARGGNNEEEDTPTPPDGSSGQREGQEDEEIPEKECRTLILKALVALGCKAPVEDVLRRAYEKEQAIQPSRPWPGPPHWRERLLKCGRKLVREKYLTGDAAGETWEVSYKGWEYYQAL